MSGCDWQTIPIKPNGLVNKRKHADSSVHDDQVKKRDCAHSSNRFSELDIEAIEIDGSTADTDEIQAVLEDAQPKPPPIVIPNVNNINDMIKHFCTVITKQEFKFTATRDGQVRVMVKSVVAYRNLIKHLESSNTLFHTYQVKQERAYRVVIKNLHHTTNIEDIKNELLTHGHDARNIINVRKRITKEPLSMFFVDLEPKESNKNVYEIKHINNAIVKIEPPRKFNDIVQCHRCQQFGHTKAYCKKPFKCGLDHATADCKKDRETPPQCVHCLKNHTANYKGCQTYQDHLSRKTHNSYLTKRNVNARNQVFNENFNSTKNFNNNFDSNQGATYANVCKGQFNNDNNLNNKIETMLNKQMKLMNVIITMISSLMQKLCK